MHSTGDYSPGPNAARKLSAGPVPAAIKMDMNTKITILGVTLTYIQLSLILSIVLGGAYYMHVGPFKNT